MRTFLFGLALAAVAAAQSTSSAQDGSSHHRVGAPTQSRASPYAGLEQRSIKALSDQQIADLCAGRGIGMALPAELNGYPGPRHVLELAAPLGLSADQVARTKALFQAMKDEVIPLGEALIAREAELDRLFATRSATPEALQQRTSAASEQQGKVRAAHLKYHLAMLEVLTPDQVAHYSELRGYKTAR